MNVSRTVQYANGFVNVRPMVRLAAKLVGSGPNRLKMVKLSHQLSGNLAEDDARAS